MRSLRHGPASAITALSVCALPIAFLTACGNETPAVAPMAAVASATSASAGGSTSHKATTTTPGRVKDPKATAGTVMLRSHGKQWCSGVRIAPTWVATARHCVQDPKTKKQITVTGVYTNTVTLMNGPMARVKKVYPAPTGDVALVELASAPPGVVVGLAPKKSVVVNAPVTIMQWNTTNVLAAAPAKVKHREKGKTYGGHSYLVNCAQECPDSADAGAPLIVDGHVAGLLSWGAASDYRAYTCLDTVLDWIVSTAHVVVDAAESFHDVPDYHSPEPFEVESEPLPEIVFVHDDWVEAPLPWEAGRDDNHDGMSDDPQAEDYPHVDDVVHVDPFDYPVAPEGDHHMPAPEGDHEMPAAGDGHEVDSDH